MRKVIAFTVLLNIGLVAGDWGIVPKQLTVDLPKNCEVLMLNTERDRESKKIITHLSVGDKVENMGCIRDITQKELDAVPANKRYFMAWKYPVWCKVAVGKKQGWVLQTNLKNELIKEVDDDI